MALLEVEGLEAQYGWTKVLHGVSFSVEEGAIATILGANGAGKTTTLRAVCGMVRVAGEIRFDGRRITGAPTEDVVRLGIAHVPEGRGTFMQLTVEENLKLGAYARRERGSLGRNLDRVFEYFPVLRERRQQIAGSLSGGEQQMLAVARALMTNPALLLLDEPLEGLAPIVVAELTAAIRRMAADGGAAVILVEQHAEIALALTEAAIVLERGSIVHRAPSRALLADHATLERLVGLRITEGGPAGA
jgi:branched-chain amino acid transport system ATP-binding protein